MKMISNFNHPDTLRFTIGEDKGIGFYLYVYNEDKCIFDDLQDTIEWVIQVANEEYGVPIDSWKKTED